MLKRIVQHLIAEFDSASMVTVFLTVTYLLIWLFLIIPMENQV